MPTLASAVSSAVVVAWKPLAQNSLRAASIILSRDAFPLVFFLVPLVICIDLPQILLHIAEASCSIRWRCRSPRFFFDSTSKAVVSENRSRRDPPQSRTRPSSRPATVLPQSPAGYRAIEAATTGTRGGGGGPAKSPEPALLFLPFTRDGGRRH